VRESPPPSYRRTLTGFEPVSATAKRFWQETTLGAIVKLDGKRPRNLARHNFYWKMLTVAADNIEAFETADQLHTAIKASLGYGRWVEVPGASRPLFIEDSTSFGKMSEADFAEFLDKAAKVITRYWLNGVAVEQLMEETRHAA
jgi:hypothetical protein